MKAIKMRASSFSFSLLLILISVYHPPPPPPHTALVALRPTPTMVPLRRTTAQFFPLLLPYNTHPFDSQRARTFGHVPSILFFLSFFRIFFFMSPSRRALFLLTLEYDSSLLHTTLRTVRLAPTSHRYTYTWPLTPQALITIR